MGSMVRFIEVGISLGEVGDRIVDRAVVAHVDEDRPGAELHDGRCRGDEGVRRRDHLVAGSDPGGVEREVERRRARRRRHGLRGVDGAPVSIRARRGDGGWSSEPEAMDPAKLERLVEELDGLTAAVILAEGVGPAVVVFSVAVGLSLMVSGRKQALLESLGTLEEVTAREGG